LTTVPLSTRPGAAAIRLKTSVPPMEWPTKMCLVDGEHVQQAQDVIHPVAGAAGGVDQLVLGVAIAAQVGRQRTEAGGQRQHRLLPEGGGGGVAVEKEHGDAVAAAQHVHGKAWRRHHL
jgi:hypothetical protein